MDGVQGLTHGFIPKGKRHPLGSPVTRLRTKQLTLANRVIIAISISQLDLYFAVNEGQSDLDHGAGGFT